MRVYLVRHAQAKSRDGLRYDDACQVSLTQFGIHQARLLRRYFAPRHIGRFLSSPLMRARETAELIAAEREVALDERLAEHAPSRTLTGRAFKEARVRTRQDRDFVLPGGESFNQAATRFIAVLDDLRQERVENAVLVSHALIMEAALTTLFNLKEIPRVDEASVSLIEWRGGQWQLAYVNRRMFSLRTFFMRVSSKLQTMRKR